MITLGIDSGSKSTKAVLYDGKEILDVFMMPTSANPRKSLYNVYEKYNKNKIDKTVVTGYGRNLLEEADETVTEITCHARGSFYLNNKIQGVIDIGGQDSKVILLNPLGQVSDFLMNDKCAAGTGRFIENIMRILEQELGDLDDFVKGHQPTNISSMCTVFAESEVVSLLAKDTPPGDIALGIIHSITKRTAQFAKRLPLEETVFFSGGLANSKVMTEALEKFLGKTLITHPLSQYAGAIGAAIIGFSGRGK